MMGKIKLYPHQLEVLDKMHNGCILCGDTGSGKSRTAIAYYYLQNGGELADEYVSMENPQDLYIITTAHKRDLKEWDADMAPFMLSPIPEHSFYSNKIVIDSWNKISAYKDVEDAFFIFDEQKVTGRGVWVKSFLEIAKKNSWILLSATPGDTWSDYIPVFIANGYFKNRSQFNNEHVVYKPYNGKFPQVDRYIGTGRLLKMRNAVLVDMNYRRPANLHPVYKEASYDAEAYKNVLKTRWNPYTNKPIENTSQLCYILRRIVNNDPSRLNVVLDLAMKRKKAIIFYNFDYELEALHWLFDPLPQFDVAEYNGHKHEQIPKSDQWVFFVHYAAGAEGWNCIETDSMIFFSQNYSYKVVKQATGRIDRNNTPFKDLYFYHIRSKAPIDLAINRALKQKKNFNERAYFGGG